MTLAFQYRPGPRTGACGGCPKTRAWPETEAALVNRGAAARELRNDLAMLA